MATLRICCISVVIVVIGVSLCKKRRKVTTICRNGGYAGAEKYLTHPIKIAKTKDAEASYAVVTKILVMKSIRANTMCSKLSATFLAVIRQKSVTFAE